MRCGFDFSTIQQPVQPLPSYQQFQPVVSTAPVAETANKALLYGPKLTKAAKILSGLSIILVAVAFMLYFVEAIRSGGNEKAVGAVGIVASIFYLLSPIFSMGAVG